MEMIEYSDIIGEDPQIRVSVPRGGPIFVPELVGPLTSVYEFESAVYEELESLKALLYSESCTSVEEDEDMSVEELKVFTDEELVGKAMEEAFKGGQNTENPSVPPGNLPSTSQEADHGVSDERPKCSSGKASDSCDPSNGCSCQAAESEEVKEANPRRRKRRKKIVNVKKVAVDESYLVKARELAKLRQKQIEDKAAAELQSLQSAAKKQSTRGRDNKLKKNHGIVFSENNERIMSFELLTYPPKHVKSSYTGEYVAVSDPEVVLCIEVYHSNESWRKIQEIMVLGRQPLTDLKDKIYCLTDTVMEKAKRYTPSGYFLIEDTFCNDMRDPAAIDYSKPILSWLRDSEDEALTKWENIISGVLKKSQRGLVGEQSVSNLPHFRAVEMHGVRFCDLRFRLGAGYFYCHQGNCKHTIIIRDMRLIHPEDVQNRAAYPLVAFQRKYIMKKCAVCEVYKSTKVTLDDKLAQKNPCYLCENCYYLLHYSGDGSLLYDQFSVFDHVQGS